MAPRILSSSAPADPPGRSGESEGSGNAVWAWVGLTFLVVGGVDLLLTWYPLDMGNREWEFGSYTAAMNGLPVPVLGLAALLHAGKDGRRWVLAIAALAALGLLGMVLLGGVLWATGIPLAMEAVPAQLAVGLKKALVKTAVQGVAYTAFLGYVLWRAARGVRRSSGSAA